MKTILIVEDQPDVQTLLGVALRADDRRILHCQNAEAALDMLQSEIPDMVLLDIMMPGRMDGMDLLQHMRSNRAFDRVRIIVISARAQQSDRVKVLSAGADGFVAKPFRLDHLDALIDQYLSSG